MLTSFRGWLAFATLLVAIGIIEWQLVPIPPAPKTVRIADESWRLPVASKVRPDQALELLIKNNLWGKLPEAEAIVSPTNPEWHFLGIVTNGTERFVMIKIEGQPKTLHISESLPGGSKILKIENDKICILVNGKKRTLGIYKMGPQVL